MPWDIGNPHRPEIVGPELHPVLTVEDLPVDQSQARVMLATIPDAFPTVADGLRTNLRVRPSGSSRQHLYLTELFAAAEVDRSDEVQRVALNVTAGTLSAGATLAGGAASVQAALANAGDGQWVEFDDGALPPNVAVQFDASPLTAFLSHRVVHVAIEYAAFRHPDVGFVPATPPPFSLFARWRVTAGAFGDLGLPEVAPSVAASVVREWSFGEINPLEAAAADEAWPWTVQELLLSDSIFPGTRELRIERAGVAETDMHTALDYLKLVAYLVPERRAAVSGVRFSSGFTTFQGSNAPAGFTSGIVMRTPLDVSPAGVLPAAAFAPGDYALSIREAKPPDPNADLPSLNPSDKFDTEAAGPSVNFVALRCVNADALNPQAIPARVLYQDGVPAMALELEETLFPALTLRDTPNVDGSYWPLFTRTLAPTANQVFTGNPGAQVLEAPPLGVTYDQIRLMVRKPVGAGPSPLSYNVGASGGSVTSTAVDNGLPVGGGWVIVTGVLTPPYIGTGLDVPVNLISGQPATDPWWVAGSEARADRTYDPPAVQPDGTATDVLHVTIHTEPPVPTLDAVSAVPTPTTGGALCCADEVNDVLVDWSISGGGWDTAIERAFSLAGPWVEVGRVPDSDGEFIDRSAPLREELHYRVRVCRTMLDNICSDPSNVETIAPLPDGGCAFVLSTADASLAYAPSDARQVTLEWIDRNQVGIIDLHGRDYPASLREPEQRGLSVTFDAVVEAFGCGATESGLSPRPYDVLRELARYEDEVWLRLPNEVRQVTVQVGALRSTPSANVHVASITLTETGPHVYAP